MMYVREILIKQKSKVLFSFKDDFLSINQSFNSNSGYFLSLEIVNR